jgi:hypothetical protein
MSIDVVNCTKFHGAGAQSLLEQITNQRVSAAADVQQDARDALEQINRNR